jgi:aspartyl-tRNA(Asn)/glutamyl-tRNA(Gln) amidotransferase subunit A
MGITWLTATAADLGRGIGAGEIDPVELTEAYLEAIGARHFTPRIFARLTEYRARSEAIAASGRAKSGARIGPLDGVPISWKDLFDTAGVATEAGSALLEGRTPDHDADVLRKATGAGLVCLGKTHMTELAFSGLGMNPVTASPPCVNDHDAVSGGSSSGAATSVAFGLAAAGIGSDTGGSVRIPAAWNDLVGLKTTSGLLPLTGVVPLAARFDTVGPLCRSVEDAGLVLAAMQGCSAPDLRGVDLSGVRLGVLETCAFDDIEDAPAAAFEACLPRLEAAGAIIERIRFDPLEALMASSGILFASEAYGTWKDVIEAAPEKMFPQILERFRSGAMFDAPSYVAAWHQVDRTRAAWNAHVAGFDLILIPSCPIMPPNGARLDAEDAYFKRANLMTLRNTRIGNLLGLSALTLPTGTPSCGLMAMGKPMGEAHLLRIGAALEAALS